MMPRSFHFITSLQTHALQFASEGTVRLLNV